MTDSKSRCVVEISTDTRSIVYLTIDRLSTDYRPTIDQLSTDHRPTIDRPSTDYRPTIGRLSTDCRPTIDRLSTDYPPSVDRLSTDCRPLYRPLRRPISRSTLPTVNKIRQLHMMVSIVWTWVFWDIPYDREDPNDYLETRLSNDTPRYCEHQRAMKFCSHKRCFLNKRMTVFFAFGSKECGYDNGLGVRTRGLKSSFHCRLVWHHLFWYD